MQSIAITRQANQQLEAKLQLGRTYGAHESQEENEWTAYPVRVLPDVRADIFYGRQSEIDKIHNYLGDPSLEKLRTYLVYGRRGIGKTQIALEYAHRHTDRYDAVFWVSMTTLENVSWGRLIMFDRFNVKRAHPFVKASRILQSSLDFQVRKALATSKKIS